MAGFKALLRNRHAIFLFALAAGLLVPFAVPASRHLVIPALAWVMTLALLEIENRGFQDPRSLLLSSLLGLIMNYLIMGSVLIGLATLILRDEAIWTGFVLLAAVPPAIAVIPFSTLLKGNIRLSLFGTLGAHLGGLAIMPLIILILLETSGVDPRKLLLVSGQLILLPLILSRLLLWKGWKDRIEPYRGAMTNWGFFVVLYTMVGLNRNLLFERFTIVLPIVAILILSTFLLGFLIDRVGRLLRLPRETRTSLVLLGTLKNQGTAGGIAITFFSQEASLPAALSTMVMIGYILWLDFRKRRDG